MILVVLFLDSGRRNGSEFLFLLPVLHTENVDVHKHEHDHKHDDGMRVIMWME